MSVSTLRIYGLILLLAACAPSSQKGIGKENNLNNAAVIPSIDLPDSLATAHPLSLLELPQTPEGQVILSEGFYEADYKSYCLQPGTPSPSSRDAYLQAPLRGYRKGMVETILRRSLHRNDLEQKNVQLLLWAVVSGSDYSRLSSSVKNTATQLMTPEQLFEFNGGVRGVVNTFSAAFPEAKLPSYQGIQQLFAMGNSSYEMFERIAVPSHSSVISKADYKIDQWYKQPKGYYVRYFPSSYQKVKVQVYVPKGIVDPEPEKTGKYLLFDPVTMMAVPANSNAQRLGIGAPMVFDAVIKIIQINKGPAGPVKKPVVNKNPKAAS